MKDIIPFFFLMGIIVFQRIVELFIAKKNEIWMKDQGAVEFGREHYRVMVGMHILFFISLLSEKIFLNRGLTIIWPLLLSIFLVTQFLRIWVIVSLGKYWNTKIIVLPGTDVVIRGPYRYIKHPNYLIVGIELVVIPLLFNDYATAVLFTLLNMVILSIRIPAEEKALKRLTEYEGAFENCNRFIPKMLHKYEN